MLNLYLKNILGLKIGIELSLIIRYTLGSTHNINYQLYKIPDINAI